MLLATSEKSSTNQIKVADGDQRQNVEKFGNFEAFLRFSRFIAFPDPE